MKTLQSFLFAIYVIILSFSIHSYAEERYETTSAQEDDVSYYENEGRLIFKLRAAGVLSKAKQSSLPKPLVTPEVSVNPFIMNGAGVDSSTSIFFNDNFAAELSLGFFALNTKYSTLNNIANNYSGAPTTNKKRKVYMIPIALLGQYQFAPFGAIRPYAGAGWHGAYLFSKAKEFKVKNGHGPVLQLGVDLVANDDTLINIDVRQYFLKAGLRYKGALVKGTGVTSKVKINPLIVSVGIGFKL